MTIQCRNESDSLDVIIIGGGMDEKVVKAKVIHRIKEDKSCPLSG